MSGPEMPMLAEIRVLDPEIDRLLYIRQIIGTLVNRAHTLLEPHEFSQSLANISNLAITFNSELEVSLLKAYDYTAFRQSLS